MLIGLARVSTSSQDHALQVDALKAAGCERIFVETVSGTKADRPELRKALDYLRDGEDVLVVYSLSRLARSIRNLIEIGDELQRRRIGLKSLTEAIDTTTPAGRFLYVCLGALGQLEVDLLRERTVAGLRAARARGRVGGRPKALDATKVSVIKALMAQGVLTVDEIAEQVGVATSTIYRHLPGGRGGMAA
jgi:DNA invertase Pin-like site-specific DNA recombinase